MSSELVHPGAITRPHPRRLHPESSHGDIRIVPENEPSLSHTHAERHETSQDQSPPRPFVPSCPSPHPTFIGHPLPYFARRATVPVISEEQLTTPGHPMPAQGRHRPADPPVARATFRAHPCTQFLANQTTTEPPTPAPLTPIPTHSRDTHRPKSTRDVGTLALLEPLPVFPGTQAQGKRISRNTLASRTRNLARGVPDIPQPGYKRRRSRRRKRGLASPHAGVVELGSRSCPKLPEVARCYHAPRRVC